MAASRSRRRHRQLLSAVGGTIALALVASGLMGLGGGLLASAGWPRLADEREPRAQILPLSPRAPVVDGERMGDASPRSDRASRPDGTAPSRAAADAPRMGPALRAGPGDGRRPRPAADRDGDGLLDAVESRLGTSPVRADSDADAMPDGWETLYVLDPLDAADAQVDDDGDGLTNRTEFRVRASPRTADSDADGRSDARDDLDRDGVPNLVEQRLAIDPAAADSDRDGRPDGADDPDADGLPTIVEVSVLLDPARPVTDGARGSDGRRDSDGDGVANAAELEAGTDPATPQPSAPRPAETASDLAPHLESQQSDVLRPRP